MSRYVRMLAGTLVAAMAMGGLIAEATAGVRRAPPPDGRAGPAQAAAARPELASVVRMQDAFALDLYARLGAESKDGNVFFSPYSVFAALAMTAEGARGETADQMGHALHLPASQRRRGAGAAARPWDFLPVHAGLGALAQAIERRDARGSPALRARVDSLRTALAAANERVGRPPEGHGDTVRATTPETAQRIADQLNALLPQVDQYELRIANALWGDARHPFDPGYVRTIAAHYGTGSLRSADFRGDAEAARQRVNAWAAENTAQHIPELFPPGSVSALTRLVLASAVYFRGEWAEVFDAARTRQERFTTSSGDTLRVPLMSRSFESVRYGAFRVDGSAFATPREREIEDRRDAGDPVFYPGAGGFQVAELPYKGGRVSMVVLLPASPGGLAALERRLDTERIAAWLGALEDRRVVVFLPRFRLELGRELSGALSAMGMPRAFVAPETANAAQFGGMTAGANPLDALYLDGAVHRTFLEVNEKGTEAAAATGMNMKTSSAMRTIPFVPVFRADRPFLFLIRDVRTGAILFMGRYARP